MNWEHITAILRATGKFHWAKIGDDLLLTNGHFAVLGNESTIEIKGEPYEPLAALWKRGTEVGRDLKTGKLRSVGGNFYRKIGTVWINEAFIRCFPDAQFFSTTHTAVGVRYGSKVVALVMPARGDDAKAVKEPVSDVDVFVHFSSKANDHYLATVQRIDEMIGLLHNRIHASRITIRDAEANIVELELDIRILEHRKKTVHVEPAAPLPQTITE